MKSLATLWRVVNRPSTHFTLGFLTVGGFIAGIIFWGAFNTALEVTNTETFCVGCHEMRDNVFAELKTTIHYTNRSGVRATCPDCHVPHEWTNKIARKMQASKEVWGHDLRHHLDAREISRAAPDPGPARVGPPQGQQLAGVPQLPQPRLHGLHPPEHARRRGPRPLPRHRREDLHRLPQGHRPRAPRHGRGGRLISSRPGRATGHRACRSAAAA